MSSVAQPRIALGCGRHGMRRNCGSIPPLAKAGSCCQRLRLWSHPGIAHAGLADAVGAALGLSYSKFSLARIPSAACRSQVTAGIIRVAIDHRGAHALRGRYAEPGRSPGPRARRNGAGFGSRAADVTGAMNGSFLGPTSPPGRAREGLESARLAHCLGSQRRSAF